MTKLQKGDRYAYIPFNTKTNELLTEHSFSNLDDLNSYYEGFPHVIAIKVTKFQIQDLLDDI